MATARLRRSTRIALTLAASGLAAASVVSTATAADAARQTSTFSPYVALGDSYAAGPNIPNPKGFPPGCLRSNHNYATDVADELGLKLTDVTCSGATTSDMTGAQKVPFGSNPPQFDALSKSTRLVTVTIGGNDAGVLSLAVTCARLALTDLNGSPCQRAEGDTFRKRIQDTAPKVAAVVRGIHDRAPNAKIAVVDYLRVLPHQDGCFPLDPFAKGDIPWLDGLEQQLNDVLSDAAHRAHAVFVDAYAQSAGHDSCQPVGTEWVEPATPRAPAAPLHPNAAGMQAVADMIEHALH